MVVRFSHDRLTDVGVTLFVGWSGLLGCDGDRVLDPARTIAHEPPTLRRPATLLRPSRDVGAWQPARRKTLRASKGTSTYTSRLGGDTVPWDRGPRPVRAPHPSDTRTRGNALCKHSRRRPSYLTPRRPLPQYVYSARTPRARRVCSHRSYPGTEPCGALTNAARRWGLRHRRRACHEGMLHTNAPASPLMQAPGALLVPGAVRPGRGRLSRRCVRRRSGNWRRFRPSRSIRQDSCASTAGGSARQNRTRAGAGSRS